MQTRTTPIRVKTATASAVAFALFALASYGGIPVKWTTDTFKVKPLAYECYHGETLDLAASLTAYGEPLALGGRSARLWWQTADMGDTWYETNATIRVDADTGATNVLAATFSGAFDTGKERVTGFVGVVGENYRAAFELRFRASPGFVPSSLPMPPKSIDWATVANANAEAAPFALKGSGGDPNAVTNVLTNGVSIVANRVADIYEPVKAIAESASVTNAGAVAAAKADAAGMTNNIAFAQLKTKPNTLGGYGIGDAYTKAQTDAGFVPWVTDASTNKTSVTIGSRPTLDDVLEWRDDEEYNQNELVKKDGIVYICTVDCQSNVSPGTWESQSEYWGEVKVGPTSLVQGIMNVARINSDTGGYGTHAEGCHTHAEGYGTHAEGDKTHAEGDSTHAEGNFTHAEGNSTHAEGDSTHAEGWCTHAEGGNSHADGESTHAEGNFTHAEGYGTHAEGDSTRAEGNFTHAEGDSTRAEGDSTHAEGYYAQAEGYGTHAEGDNTHAEGWCTHAEGYYAHAGRTPTNEEEKEYDYASWIYGTAAHASGWCAVATNQSAFVWQGVTKDKDAFSEPEESEKYYDHGAGTYNINPVGGLTGFWIGETNMATHTSTIATNAAEAVVAEVLDYALTNLTGATVSLRSGEIGNLTLSNAQTNLALSLDFSASPDRSGDAMLYLVNAADTELAVGPSASVTPIGYKASDKLKAGTNLVCVTRLAYSGGKSVVNVAIREVK